MNIKELKQYNKFLYKIMEIFDVQDNQVECNVDSSMITFTAFKTKERLSNEVLYTFQLSHNATPVLSVISRTLIEEKKKYSWSNPTFLDICLFSYSPEFGLSFHDKDNICYEFSKSSHFNLSLDNNMFLPFNKYRDLYQEFKKVKMNYSLVIYGF